MDQQPQRMYPKIHDYVLKESQGRNGTRIERIDFDGTIRKRSTSNVSSAPKKAKGVWSQLNPFSRRVKPEKGAAAAENPSATRRASFAGVSRARANIAPQHGHPIEPAGSSGEVFSGSRSSRPGQSTPHHRPNPSFEMLHRLRQDISDGRLERTVPPAHGSHDPTLRAPPRPSHPLSPNDPYSELPPPELAALTSAEKVNRLRATSTKVAAYIGSGADALDETRRGLLQSRTRPAHDPAANATSYYPSSSRAERRSSPPSVESFYCQGEPDDSAQTGRCRLCGQPGAGPLRGLCAGCEREFSRHRFNFHESESEFEAAPESGSRPGSRSLGPGAGAVAGAPHPRPPPPLRERRFLDLPPEEDRRMLEKRSLRRQQQQQQQPEDAEAARAEVWSSGGGAGAGSKASRKASFEAGEAERREDRDGKVRSWADLMM